MNKNTRTTQILTSEEWIDIHPLEIKKGMFFRMFEEDGTPVKNKKKELHFIASDDAYEDDGVYKVDIL